MSTDLSQEHNKVTYLDWNNWKNVKISNQLTEDESIMWMVILIPIQVCEQFENSKLESSTRKYVDFLHGFQ